MKKRKRKWNRTHEFRVENKPQTQRSQSREHPVYVFAQSGNLFKTISFTHHPTTNGKENIRLKHNIEVGSDEPCYGVPYSSPRRTSEFKMPSVGKRYRIHSDDKLNIQLLKKGMRK